MPYYSATVQMHRLLVIGLLLPMSLLPRAQAIEPEHSPEPQATAHPLAGFWQNDTCDWKGRQGPWGISLEPAGDARQYRVVRCAHCCYRTSKVAPATAIPGDPSYKIIDSGTIDVRAADGWDRYVKCSDEWIHKPAATERR